MKKIFLLIVFSLSLVTGFCQTDRTIMQETRRYRPYAASQYFRITNNGAANGRVSMLDLYLWIDSLVNQNLDTAALHNYFISFRDTIGTASVSIATIGDLNMLGLTTIPLNEVAVGTGSGVTSSPAFYYDGGGSFGVQGLANSGLFMVDNSGLAVSGNLAAYLGTSATFNWLDNFNGINYGCNNGNYAGWNINDFLVSGMGKASVNTGDSIMFTSSIYGFDGVKYNFPGSQGSSNTYLKNDGSGNLSWAAAGGGSDLINGGANLGGLGTTTVGIVKDTLNQKIRFRPFYGTYGANVINRTDSIEIKACDTLNVTTAQMQSILIANTGVPCRTYKITDFGMVANVCGDVQNPNGNPIYASFQKGIKIVGGNMHLTGGAVCPVTIDVTNNFILSFYYPLRSIVAYDDNLAVHTPLNSSPSLCPNSVQAGIKMAESDPIAFWDNNLYNARLDGYEMVSPITGVNGVNMASESWVTLGNTATAQFYYATVHQGARAFIGDNSICWYWDIGQYGYDTIQADVQWIWFTGGMNHRCQVDTGVTSLEYVTIKDAGDLHVKKRTLLAEPVVVGEDASLTIGERDSLYGAVNIMPKVQNVVFRDNLKYYKDMTIYQNYSNVEDTVHASSGSIDISSVDYVTNLTVGFTGTSLTVTDLTNARHSFRYRLYAKAGKTLKFFDADLTGSGNFHLKDQKSFTVKGNSKDWIEFESDSASAYTFYEVGRSNYSDGELVMEGIVSQVGTDAPFWVNILGDTTDFSNFVGGTHFEYGGVGTFFLARHIGLWDETKTFIETGTANTPGGFGSANNIKFDAVTIPGGDASIYITVTDPTPTGVDDYLTNTYFKITIKQ